MSQRMKAIPNHYHSINVYITTRNATESISFYQKAFGAHEKARYVMPDGRIMFAELQIGDSTLQLSDEFPEQGCGISAPASLKGTTCIIHLYVPDVDATFDAAVKAGATIKRSVENMFWGDRYGQLEDPFGHLWSIATKIEEVTSEQINERAAQLCKQSG